MNGYISHYTTVDVLALILQNKTIRFNSLKKVDDLLDGTHNNLENAQNYLFVSCWSEENCESIPLWNMYSKDMSGIRIRIKKSMFKPTYKFFQNGNSSIENNQVVNIVNNTNNIYCFTDVFEVKVKYDDIEYHKFLREIEEETSELYDISYTKLAQIKKQCWEFQKETRFVLLATSNDEDTLNNRLKRFEAMLNNARKPNVDHIDMILDNEVFSEMEILIGPKASPSSRIIIESLIDKLVPDFRGKIETSNLLIR